MDKSPCNSQDAEVRKGPWTMEEDLILINYINNHGEGVWNSLAKAADEWKDDEFRFKLASSWLLLSDDIGTKAETYSGQSSSDVNEQPSSSQMSAAVYAAENYCAPSYPANPECYPVAPFPADQLNENYWSMEDLWLLNGD
ncbi:hypothetical protein JRO89_XS01G0238800 [Xanthoceras sorbifolium]|uniref:Myb-like domain-containing protein n=1 Tax=Xanthoceras sorbifolium TaxID=99658 RepID=A0ABQ8IMJ8_9ROSI|nr:hypothetical protein JRO89_XS01G0238800 [Xanthoceras sorbifolium]